jgi:hypothetical protein
LSALLFSLMRATRYNQLILINFCLLMGVKFKKIVIMNFNSFLPFHPFWV